MAAPVVSIPVDVSPYESACGHSVIEGPHFKHTLRGASLCSIHGWHIPCSVQEELRRKGVQPLRRPAEPENGVADQQLHEENGELGQGKTQTTGKFHHKAYEDREEELRRKGVQPLRRPSEAENGVADHQLHEGNGELGDGKTWKTRKFHHKAYKDEEEEEEEEKEEEEILTISISSRNQTQQEASQPRTLVALLKHCAKQKDLQRGSIIHADIARMGLLDKNLFVGNALVHMYAKCGFLAKAQDVCEKLPVRDVVSWNGLIAGYVECGHGEQALNCFERLKLEGISPNAVTFLSVLKACGQLGAIDKGQVIHAEILREGLLEKDVVVGTALVDMYAKCGFLGEAQEVFDQLPARDVVSWNVLITSYAQRGHGEQALNLFKQMQLKGPSPDEVTFLCILKACGNMKAADQGRSIHAEIVKEGLLEKHANLGNALIDMYLKCSLLAEAWDVFHMLPARDEVSWNTLISGYAQHGDNERALQCFEWMQSEGFPPDTVTFGCILKACSSLGAKAKGQAIHADIIRAGLLGKDIIAGNALVDMYAKCGLLEQAQEVFENLATRDVVTWNILITGFLQHGYVKQAMKCVESMQLEGFSPDTVTLLGILKACGSMRALGMIGKVQMEIIRKGFFEEDFVVATALIDSFVQCGLLAKAQELFDKLAVRNVFSWNALIAGYAQQGYSEQALDLFGQMKLEGLSPDAVTFLYALKACGSIRDIDKGQEIHAEIVNKGLLENDITIGTTLIDMYAKCGHLSKAQEVFDKLSVRDAISWSVLIAGYAEHGPAVQALHCFECMQLEGFSLDAALAVCILKACGTMGAADKGQEIHTMIAREGYIENDTVVGTALVDMYVKCGLLVKAKEVFDKLCGQDLVSWNVLLTGHALHGKAEHVFETFDKMVGEGIQPDVATFTIMLNACSHAGLLEKGQYYFDIMSAQHGLAPTLEHHACLVDLLARAGHLEKAVAMIKQMPFSATTTVWHTVLAACQKWGNVKVGRLAYEALVQLDENNASAHVCMSNIYVDSGRQEDVNKELL